MGDEYGWAVGAAAGVVSAVLLVLSMYGVVRAGTAVAGALCSIGVS